MPPPSDNTPAPAANGFVPGRNALAVWPCLFAVSLGLQAVMPTLPLYIEERFGIDDPRVVQFWAGFVFACGPLAAAFTGPFWGLIGDRFGRRAMVLRAALTVAVVNLLIPLAPTPGTMAALRIVQGIGAGFVAPALALGTEGVPAARQARVMANLQFALALGLLVGPQVGSALLEVFDDRAVLFRFTSVMSLVATLPIVLYARDDPAAKERRRAREAEGDGAAVGRSRLGGLFAALRGLPNGRVFVLLMVCIFLLRFGQNMTEPQIAMYVRELGPLDLLTPDVGASGDASEALETAVDRTTGLAFSILALTALVFVPVWGRISELFGPLRCLAALAAGLGLCRIAAAVAPSSEVFLGVRVLASVFMAGSMTLAYASVARRVGSDQRALAFGYVQSSMQLGFSIGPLLGGVYSGLFGLRQVFVLSGVCLLGTATWMLHIRRITNAPGPLPASAP